MTRRGQPSKITTPACVVFLNLQIACVWGRWESARSAWAAAFPDDPANNRGPDKTTADDEGDDVCSYSLLTDHYRLVCSTSRLSYLPNGRLILRVRAKGQLCPRCYAKRIRAPLDIESRIDPTGEADDARDDVRQSKYGCPPRGIFQDEEK